MGNTILIAVSIIVFFAGFGVASVVHYNPSNAPLFGHGMTGLMTNPETMNQMMNDPDFRNEMMEVMITDTEHMNQWMQDDPQHIPLMIEKMKVNHDFMMGMALPMIQDPVLRLQVLGHMTESPEAMIQMQQMIGGEMTGQGMMSSETMKEMMEDPEIRYEMIELMSTQTTEMQELLSSELSDEEFDTKMIELMSTHQQSMTELMDDVSMDHDESAGHDETADHDEATMGMSAPPQTYIVSLAEGSGVPGCELTDECFLPYSLEIWVSDTVSWNNVDSAAHTVTSGPPNKHDGNFDSGMMIVNQTWEFTFTDSGEYDYYCTLHPWMTGKIIVNEVEEMIVIP